MVMKKFLLGFAGGVGTTLAVWRIVNWSDKILLPHLDKNRENPLKPYLYDGKVVGIRFGNVVFALHDAPQKFDYKTARKYCEKQYIGNKKCSLPKAGMETYIPQVFKELNTMLIKWGGKPLKAKENEGYWADGMGGLAWIIAFDKPASDYYNYDEKAYVRPVVFLED